MKKMLMLFFVLAVCVGGFNGCMKLEDEYDGSTEYQNTIAALEAELALLKQAQEDKNSESEKRIAELTEQLKKLQSREETVTEEITSAAENVGFKYTVEDGKATVTGYSGNETSIVVPKTIDGYTVTAIGERAFENSDFKSVVISDGIKSVGWFAFADCMELESVIVPSSVCEIGYGAFGSAGSTLTLFCHSESYALSYAKSFGLTYAII